MEYADSLKNSSSVLLSIIIPVWNREKEISYCLESIICQDNVEQIEIIVVNDCSTDNTLKTINRIINDASVNIQIINNDRRSGAAASRNIGLKNARGSYIWFIDSDDYISKDALEIILPQFQKNPDIIRFDKIHASEVFSDYQIPADKQYIVQDYILQSGSNALLFLSFGSVWNAVFSRKIIGNIKFDESFSYGEDALFTWSVTLQSNIIVYIKAPLYAYMFTPISLTGQKNFARFSCYIQLIEKFILLIDNANLNEKTKRLLYHDCYWRIYTHAFGCYNYHEISDSMWTKWFETYKRVMICNKKRCLLSRFFSSILYCLRIKRLFIVIYNIKMFFLRLSLRIKILNR